MGSISTIWHTRHRATHATTAAHHLRKLSHFTAISKAAGTIYGLYYGVFLYKHTVSLSVLALDGLFTTAGTWLGYLLGVNLLRRFGYSACIKAAFGLWATTAFVTALAANHISGWFIPLALLKGLPAGIFAVASEAIVLREAGPTERGGYYQLSLVAEFMASIILPPIVGLVVHAGSGYQITFVCAGILYALACLAPTRLSKPELVLNPRQMLALFKRPLYPQHAANRVVAAGFNQLNAFVIMIIPFMLLKSEVAVGLLTSGAAVVAALVALTARRLKQHRNLGLGYSAYAIRTIAGLVFISSWTAPAMLAWQLVGKLLTPLHDPLQTGIDVHNDSLILGKDLKQQALHINLLNNTGWFVGSALAYGGFYFITRAAQANQRGTLQTLIVSFAIWRAVNLTIATAINRQASRPRGYSAGRVPVAVALRRALGYPLLRLRMAGVL